MARKAEISHEPLGAAAAQWDELADATGAGPFVRPGWIEAWARAFSPGHPITVLTVRRNGELVGAIPSLAARRAFVSPTNWHTPAFGAVALDEDARRSLAVAAVEQGARADLSFLDPGEPFTDALLAAAAERQRRLIVRPALRSPYLRLEGDFDSYCRTRPSKFFREIKRRRRRLGEHGEVTVVFTDGRDDLDGALREGLAVEGSGWKTDQGTAILQDPAAERFYRDIAAWAAERGWLQLGFVRVGGRAVAFSYSIVAHGTVHVVKVGFDPEFARYAVGTLMTCEAIERAYAQGQQVYDFLGGEDRYKLDWTDDVRERVRVQAFARSAPGTAAFLAWRVGRPVAKRALQLTERARR